MEARLSQLEQKLLFRERSRSHCLCSVNNNCPTRNHQTRSETEERDTLIVGVNRHKKEDGPDAAMLDKN